MSAADDQQTDDHSLHNDMDVTSWVVLALAMACATWHAHRIGDERRDLALLGTGSGTFAAF